MYITLKEKSILIIEDDQVNLECITKLFQNFVHKIYHASDSISAIKIFESISIDCIVCDILLGKEDGLELIKTIRERDHLIPIIVMSGHINEDTLMRAIPLNLVAFLQKPIKYSQFMDALNGCSAKMRKPVKKVIYIKNDYYYDIELKVITKNGKVYKLHHREILFIEMALRHMNTIITKEMFYEFVWQFEEMSDSALKNFILRIRRRFGKDFIETINHIGYRF